MESVFLFIWCLILASIPTARESLVDIDRSMAPAQKFLHLVKVFYAGIASHGRLDENKR